MDGQAQPLDRADQRIVGDEVDIQVGDTQKRRPRPVGLDRRQFGVAWEGRRRLCFHGI